MAEFCIGCGKCSYLYIYIFGFLSFNVLKKISLHFSSTLNDQKLMQNVYTNCGFVLFGIIFYNKYKKYTKNINNDSNKKETRGSNYSLIYNDTFEHSLIDTRHLIIVCVIYAFYYETKKIMKFLGYYDIEIWTFEIIFVLLLMNIYFPQHIYKHQKFSMMFIIIIDTILILYASSLKTYQINPNEYQNLYQIKGFLHCLLFGLVFIDITFLFSYARIRGKILMDIYFISPCTFSIIIGAIGLFFNFILLIIFIAKRNDEDYMNDVKSIYYYLNIPKYFTDISKCKGMEFILELIIVPIFYWFFSFMTLMYELLILKYLNPNYILMSDNIFYEIIKIKDFILSYIKKEITSEILKKFWVLQFAEIFEFIGCIIYLEIIILRFCGFNEDIKINIMERGEKDLHELCNLEDSNYVNETIDSRLDVTNG